MEEKTLYDYLLRVQSEIGAIQKSSENNYYKSSYFDINDLLQEVKPILTKYGLVLTQPLTTKDGRMYVSSVISNGVEDVESTLILPDIVKPQELGSCITYYRRYTLVSLLALQAEDDDGNATKDATQKGLDRHINAIIKSGELQKAKRYMKEYKLTPPQEKKLKEFFNL
ncbi:MAG: putative essential recombination function protein [Prokaryotic dsDNA virus sp.]|jgi:hypothetical protein|nr:MAG: putative essential recombination function protein [Prokaryotic dsDNA virus sp.]|tara:strand:- start:602 stop:1108 length:507 start_codon:yes stop_codon:yes gene_type:complete